ncbi:MAG: sodium:solute symporter [Flavobacteriales bacterium]|nr:sodium:solute symporter [Flavobacteriales bacterium]
MSPTIIITVLLAYFAVLFLISHYTSKNATNQSFFQANKSAPWMLVAFGMVGTSLSGVTFISVPGTVGASHFYYFQVVLGYFIGYFIVAYVLLPLYYRYNLTSIYTYLQHRFGFFSYKTGASMFIISRTLGATLRLYLVINVLQLFVLDQWHIPFWFTALIILLMIIVYTFKGGVKTIVWTDTLQTFFMLLALIICVLYIIMEMDLSIGEAWRSMKESGHLNIFNFDVNDKKFFLKQIIGGAFITVSMTGLDQEMMQKNISVKTLKDSQKNMITFSAIMVFVNFIFLFLGGMLTMYSSSLGMDVKGDDLFPTIAMKVLPGIIGLVFIVGLISALFPSADGAITALTASFCIDILGMNRNNMLDEKQKSALRKKVHLTFSGLFLLMVLFFKWLDNKEVVSILLDIASYTYGPLLGLFAFGIITKRKIQDNVAPIICVLAPAMAFVLDKTSAMWLGGYKFGFEMLAINGLITFSGLMLISNKSNQAEIDAREI